MRAAILSLLLLPLAACGGSPPPAARPDEVQAVNTQRIQECQQIVRQAYLRNTLTNLVPKLTTSGRETTVDVTAQADGSSGSTVNYRCFWRDGFLVQAGPIR